MQLDRTDLPAKKHRSRALRWIAAPLACLLVAGAVGVEYAIHHAEPILRARVVQTLSTRFDSHVELGEFHVSLYPGLDVQGGGLTIQSNLYPDMPPQISVQSFSFHAGVLDLFRKPMHVGSVEIAGLVLRVPTKSGRAAIGKSHKKSGSAGIAIDRIVCKDALLIMQTDDPKKFPLQFKIHALALRRVGPNRPLHFDAELVNPRPIGDIQAAGNFGPWRDQQPGDTPIEGAYSFTHADLGTTKGIAGTLSSTGRFHGKLDTIAVDGTTDTPDFSLHVSGHKVALHTEFHAVVNGTNGNTYLRPVHAHFLHTDLTATGYVVRARNLHGHDIHLYVQIDHGRVEDLLLLGIRTLPAVMSGALRLKTRFDLPAGRESVSSKLHLAGTYAADNVSFSNLHLQKRVDELSLRSQGEVAQAKQLAMQDVSRANALPNTPASMHGAFILANRQLTLPQLVCDVPGTEISLAGTYSLDGRIFNLAGTARMDSSVSRMVGGWKGALLSPVDSVFARHGAKTEIDITITGTQSKPHFGLKF
ncbi:MAG: AsmA family protein [Acidobacteriaceae bacterium]